MNAILLFANLYGFEIILDRLYIDPLSVAQWPCLVLSGFLVCYFARETSKEFS
jgi:hypothetical protein